MQAADCDIRGTLYVRHVNAIELGVLNLQEDAVVPEIAPGTYFLADSFKCIQVKPDQACGLEVGLTVWEDSIDSQNG
jgi:hypothetical protein